MKIVGNSVYFKSILPMFIKEKSGSKNNTVRIVSVEEFGKLTSSFYKTQKINITNTETGEWFRRNITDITSLGSFLDQRIIVISWSSEDTFGGKI
jgi:hypothetical protein